MTEKKDDNQVLQEDLLGGDEKPFEIPKWLRVTVSLVLATILLISLVIFVLYIFGCIQAEPSKLGLSNLVIFSILGLCVFLIPWHDYGLKIRKFGPFEFEQVLNTQAKEHAEEIGDLRERLKLLEDSIKVTSDGTPPRAFPINKELGLSDLLQRFLEAHSRWAFSPSRIVSWGGDQTGYEELKSYRKNTRLVRRTLQGMVADGFLETRISKKGNTLYKAVL